MASDRWLRFVQHELFMRTLLATPWLKCGTAPFFLDGVLSKPTHIDPDYVKASPRGPSRFAISQHAKMVWLDAATKSAGHCESDRMLAWGLHNAAIELPSTVKSPAAGTDLSLHSHVPVPCISGQDNDCGKCCGNQSHSPVVSLVRAWFIREVICVC